MDETINLLLVDDEPRNLDALEAILDDPSYRLLRADHADAALRQLLHNQVAAIVLDIKMPGVSGFELANLIKGTKKFRQIPILFLTAYHVDDEDILAGYSAGAVDYLTKPIKPQILRHKIAVFADLFRKTRALAELNDTLELRVKQRTEQLASSEAALRDANRQKDQFLATLAHELRNPLAPLRTGLDLLMQRPDAPVSASSRVLGAMNRQLDYMVRLIDDLLDVSRISRGVLELRREPADLAAVIGNAIELARPFIESKQQAVIFHRRAAVRTEVDPTRIAQIIGNLLHNASKFSPAKTEIHVELVAEQDDVVIRVTDHGSGIPPSEIERAFDMFSQVRGAPPVGGSGLGIGLALARRLAELHGGTLVAASEGAGRGSTFTLTLRRAAEAPAEAAAEVAATADPAARPAASGKLAIVVIEDNDDAADTLAEWLETMGHSVRVARSGPEGVDLVREHRPRLVLCDIGLPGMDGVEVCRRVKALPIARQPVMVALTGWGMEADRQRTREAGFDHHLVKPVSPDKLFDLLNQVSPE
jgi:signal transduction histidine kinase